MKTYRLKKLVVFLPVILIFLFFVSSASIILIKGMKLGEIKDLVLFLGIGLSIYAIVSTVILNAEEIIIEENGLTYKKELQSRYIRWADITDVNMRSTWTAKSELILKADSLIVNIDFHSFVNSSDLLDSILSNLRHLPIMKKTEFTEL